MFEKRERRQSRRLKWLMGHGVAVASVLVAIVIRLALDPLVGNQFPFATLFFAVLLTAWFGGFGPALVASLLGAFAANYFLIPPRGSFAIQGVDQLVGLALYLVTSIGISVLGGTMHAARQRSEVSARLERRRSALIDNTYDAVIAWDWNGAITFWNRGARRLYGFSDDEAIGRMSHELLSTTSETGGLAFVGALDQKSLWEGELEQTTRGGQRIVVESRMVLVRDGGRAYVIEVNRDISERRKAQTALHEANLLLESRVRERTSELALNLDLLEASEARMASIVDSAMDAIVSIDVKQEIVMFNAAAEKMFRCSAMDAIGRPIDRFIPPRYRERHRAHVENFCLTGVTSRSMRDTLKGLRADGEEFPVEASISQITLGKEKIFTVILRDIGDRLKAEEYTHRLRAAEDEARVAVEQNRLKSEFLANMSHEFRTPLNAIIGFSGTLLMKLPGPLNAEQEKQLQAVRTGARHLLSLINDLLDVASIEADRKEISLQTVTCQDLIDEVMNAQRHAADRKGLWLKATVPADPTVVQSDPHVLHQILMNLTGNAIKFTAVGGVTICLTQGTQGTRRGHTEISVTDTGVGIRQEDQAKLFQAFSQVDASSMRRHEGTGLGLHVSQRLAGRMGGHISVQSEFGRGSVFTLHLGG